MTALRGEVVIVDFPYSNQTGRKVRPALVIQADLLNQLQPVDTILAAISRRYRLDRTATEYAIDISTVTGQQTGLLVNSVVQCWNLTTYAQARILRVIGRLPDAAMQQVNACLKAALDIR